MELVKAMKAPDAMKGALVARDGADGLPEGYGRMQVEGRCVVCDLKPACALVHTSSGGRSVALAKLSAGDFV